MTFISSRTIDVIEGIDFEKVQNYCQITASRLLQHAVVPPRILIVFQYNWTDLFYQSSNSEFSYTVLPSTAAFIFSFSQNIKKYPFQLSIEK